MKRNTFRVGLLLGLRQIQRANIWTTLLIIFIMMLTFLNLVVVSGILVGLIEGSVQANREQYTGDVFVSTLDGKSDIEQSQDLIRTVETLPAVKNYSARYVEGGSVEANYRTRRDPQELRDTVGSSIVGIDPLKEEAVTHLSQHVTEGQYLEPGDEGYILLGANLIDRYSAGFGDGFSSLSEVYPGSRVRITMGDVTKEFTIKGIIDSKVNETSTRVFMVDTELRRLISRDTLNINELAITTVSPDDSVSVKQSLLGSGFGQYAKVRVAEEAIGTFLNDIATTFGILGNVISSIGLMVASITIFIIVFINAVTRKKYIGILKGIGINEKAIELSYVMQSLLYALAGAALGTIIVYAVLVPLVNAHPIDFPFSDGILVAPVSGTLVRLAILLVTTVLAGFIPARLIVRRNTLDSILGR